MSDALAPVLLTGIGAWSPDFDGVAALAGAESGRGERAEATAETSPPAALLTARLRRRATTLTRICAEVIEQCGPHGQPRVVMASAWGEIGVTVALLEAIARDQLLSPTAFHNSVHNAALGYVSIASDNRAASVALAAGDGGVAMGTLEAVTAVLDEATPCVFVAAEETVPAPFSPPRSSPPVGLGWRLEPMGARTADGGAPPVSAVPRSRLTLARAEAVGLDGVDGSGQHAGLPNWLSHGPLGSMAAVIVAHHRRRPAALSLGHGWHVTLEPLA